jgi:hypothetical protein
MLRRIVENYYGFNLDFHLLFIAFKQAYDVIIRTYTKFERNLGPQRN